MIQDQSAGLFFVRSYEYRLPGNGIILIVGLKCNDLSSSVTEEAHAFCFLTEFLIIPWLTHYLEVGSSLTCHILKVLQRTENSDSWLISVDTDDGINIPYKFCHTTICFL